MNEIKFTYKPKISTFSFVTIFGILGTFVMSHRALNNDRGLILNGIIEFSENGATIFYWIMTAFCLAFALVGAFTVFQGVFLQREIILQENSFSCPKKLLSSQIVSINYADITATNIFQSQQTFLEILHIGGRLSILQSALPNKQAFYQLIEILKEKIEFTKKN